MHRHTAIKTYMGQRVRIIAVHWMTYDLFALKCPAGTIATSRDRNELVSYAGKNYLLVE